MSLHPCFVLQLQQKASEVDSSRVSGAIQNLINSWKASDTQADQDAATTSSQAPQNEGESAGKAVTNSGLPNPPEQSGNAQPAEDEKQQEKRNRLLSLFSRGKNGQQQPEEMMPVRVSPSCDCQIFDEDCYQLQVWACRIDWPCALLPALTCHKGSSTMYIAKLNIQHGCNTNWKAKITRSLVQNDLLDCPM